MAGLLRGEIPDLEPLKKLVRDDLRHILESNHGVKDLFIDPDLMKPIDRLADIRFLKEHGVDKIYKIDTSKAVQGNKQIRKRIKRTDRVKIEKKGCGCGNATSTPGKLTCYGQRCPCYSNHNPCLDCRCKGCRNPNKVVKIEQASEDTDGDEINVE